MRTRRTLLLLLLVISFTAGAQEIENLAGVRITLDRAGARELAMGSTAITSTDASAVAANPAAIAGAQRSFSIEQRRRVMEGRYVVDTSLNTMGVDSETSGIRSAFLVVPAAGLTWAISYDEPLDVEHSSVPAFTNFTRAEFFVCNGRLASGPCDQPMVQYNLPATFPIDAKLRLQRLAASTAWSRGPFAAGVSVRREHLRQHAAFSTVVNNNFAGIAETIDDSATTWSAGTTWKFGDRARLGASYSAGGSFAGQRTSLDPSQPIELRTPSSIAAGVSFDPLPQLTLAADAVRVRYSEMMHEGRNVFPAQSEVGYPDVTELHAGAEYRTGKYALRAGWWRDPAHALRSLTGFAPRPPFSYAPAIVDADEDHVTAGIGYGTKTRFDASIDRGSRSTRVAFGMTSTF